ncbi:DUF2651 family protein [Alicyclobacillus cycloheptanicus]|jgi:hypothetical protein|uniref:DUF2484 family protein n=1 Tax=Alicyclobacillus cycloheptanicus TaxID=1457 RepID=A0ABT9XF30_9BACL|nr:DUF2651 family protein [Alicyclobacillus cycloheptanicus]MDQ0188908.1 hypothetical protein [Alicyclobacillus cycloheptanicus]WDM01740.1 DUF2651 family protein [Alicyclobacillus cycloheptanicus]
MGEMAWIAGWIPLLSILVSVVVYRWLKNAWVPTVAVLVLPAVAMLIWFDLANFWPWLLLYLLLCWVSCWATQQVQNLRQRRRQA